MYRVGFVMQLKPGNEAIYRQKHNEIWPEMVETLHRYGIRNYTIFRRALTLFAYYECDDPTQTRGQGGSPPRERLSLAISGRKRFLRRGICFGRRMGPHGGKRLSLAMSGRKFLRDKWHSLCQGRSVSFGRGMLRPPNGSPLGHSRQRPLWG